MAAGPWNIHPNKYYVVKCKWGHWVNDLPGFDSFAEAVEAAETCCHYNVLSGLLYADLLGVELVSDDEED